MLATKTIRSITVHRRIAIGLLIAAAFVLYFGLQLVDRPLLAVTALIGLFGAAVVLASVGTSRFFDERDRRIHQRASGTTVMLYGWICFVAFPTVIVLDALDQIAIPDWLGPISAAVLVFYLTYAGLQLAYRLR